MATATEKKKKKPRQPLSGKYGVVHTDKETAKTGENVVMRPGENNTYRLFVVQKRNPADGSKSAAKYVWASNWHEAFALSIVGVKPYDEEKNPQSQWIVESAEGGQRGQVAKLTASDVLLLRKFLPAFDAGKLPAEKVEQVIKIRPALRPYLVPPANRPAISDDLNLEADLLGSV